jgi:hypothetical protein
MSKTDLTPPPVLTSIPAETAAHAIAAQAKAAVEARYLLAWRSPRHWDEVRVKLLNECRRPSFAHNGSVLYRKPIGPGVEGLGIRFVEAALRAMGNVMPETLTLYDDATRRLIRVSVTDLEANVTYSRDLTLTKTVERAKPGKDGEYLSMRTNSRGEPVYTVLATEDEFANKEAAAISKAIRALGLRIIPGDLQDEAEALIRQTRKDRAAQDPEAERKRIADAFAGLNIRPVDLTAYLGHPLAQCTPAELVELRGLYGALRDGEATWASVMADREPAGVEPPPPPEPGEPPSNPVIVDLLSRIEAATAEDLKTLSADVSLLQGPERRCVTAAWKARQKTLQAGTTEAPAITA